MSSSKFSNLTWESVWKPKCSLPESFKSLPVASGVCNVWSKGSDIVETAVPGSCSIPLAIWSSPSKSVISKPPYMSSLLLTSICFVLTLNSISNSSPLNIVLFFAVGNSA